MDDIELDFGDDAGPMVEVAYAAKTVTSVAGHEMPVQDEGEKAFYENLRDKIVETYRFDDPSDISDLDRILMWELVTYRISKQLGQGTDSHLVPLTSRDTSILNKTLSDTNRVLTAAKNDLGLSKSARDALGEEDPATYLEDLRKRFASQGLKRNKEVNLAIAEFWNICSVAGTYLRSNELERAKTQYRSAEDILTWIIVEEQPKMVALDAHFREHGQSAWVGKL